MKSEFANCVVRPSREGDRAHHTGSHGISSGRCLDRPRSRQNLVDHSTMHVGQSEVAAGLMKGEPFVIQAEQVQDRGLQVMDVDRILGDVEAEFVGGSVGLAGLDPSACEPH